MTLHGLTYKMAVNSAIFREIFIMDEKPDLNKFYNENKDLIDKLNENYMKGFFSPVKEVYFDLPVLKDIRLGLMISLTDKNKIKDVFIKNIEKYNNRPNRSFTYAFKEIGYTEEELTKMYCDEKYHHDMFNYALDTDLGCLLKDMYQNFCDQNIRAEYKNSIIFNINTYPISEKDENIVIYAKMLSDYLRGVTINTFCTNPQKLDEKFWLRQSVIILDDINLMMTTTDSGLVKPLLQDQVMMSTKIFAPYQAIDEALADWKEHHINIDDPKQLHDAFVPTECTLQLFSNFKFIPCRIPA